MTTESISVIDKKERGSSFANTFKVTVIGKITKAILDVHADGEINYVTLNDFSAIVNNNDAHLDVTGHVFNGDNTISVYLYYPWYDEITWKEHHVWGNLQIEYEGVRLPTTETQTAWEGFTNWLNSVGLSASILIGLIVVFLIIVAILFLVYGRQIFALFGK